MSTLIITHADTQFCDFLRKRFEMRGHRILRALDAESCLARCREELPEAVIISLAFAGRHDYALLKELQAKQSFVRRIILADSADADDISDCQNFGCHFYIRRHFRTNAFIKDLEHFTKGQTTFTFTPAIPSYTPTSYALRPTS